MPPHAEKKPLHMTRLVEEYRAWMTYLGTPRSDTALAVKLFPLSVFGTPCRVMMWIEISTIGSGISSRRGVGINTNALRDSRGRACGREE